MTKQSEDIDPRAADAGLGAGQRVLAAGDEKACAAFPVLDRVVDADLSGEGRGLAVT